MTDRSPDFVLAALSAAVIAHPDQRVMQVVVNALGTDPFYVEDQDAALKLKDYALQTYLEPNKGTK